MNEISPILGADRDMRQQIAPEHREKFLNILCQHLDMGISIMDEDLNYQFISDGFYKLVGIRPDELCIGDPLSKSHDLMLENGMVTPEILKKINYRPKNKRKNNAAVSRENASSSNWAMAVLTILSGKHFPTALPFLSLKM